MKFKIIASVIILGIIVFVLIVKNAGNSVQLDENGNPIPVPTESYQQ